MCSRPQFTDLTYMGGTAPCDPMTIIFSSAIKTQRIRLNIKFDVNRMFHVLKTPVYRFDLYGRYRTLWLNANNFWQCYLELVYKPKYQICCESRYTSLVYMGCTRSFEPIQPIFNTDRPMANISLFTKFEVRRSWRSHAILISTDGQTDIAQRSQNFALIKYLQGT